MICVSGPQHILGCESRITLNKVVQERGAPMINIGLLLILSLFLEF